MSFFKNLVQLSTALILLAGVSNAHSTIITFDSLAGQASGAFASTTESGFDITATEGSWNKAFVFGSPVPSIYTSSGGANIIDVVLTAGGLFDLTSVDFGCGSGASGLCIGTVEGLLGGAQQFILNTAGLLNDGTFSTFISGTAGTFIDTLRVSMNQGDSNIDNINLSAVSVPVPATLALFGLGLAGLGWSRRKKA